MYTVYYTIYILYTLYSDFTLKDLPQSGESLEPLNKTTSKSEYLKQIQRDALWSDPNNDHKGIASSSRGAGVSFGPDVTAAFLERNKLCKYII